MNDATQTLLDRLPDMHQTETGWQGRCPAHESSGGKSLTLATGDDGEVLVHCFAGCDTTDIVAAVGLTMSDLFPEKAQRDSHGEQSIEIVVDVARLKRIPLLSFKAFGAVAAVRGRAPVARLPMYNEKRELCSEFELGTGNKGLLKGLSEKGPLVASVTCFLK